MQQRLYQRWFVSQWLKRGAIVDWESESRFPWPFNSALVNGRASHTSYLARQTRAAADKGTLTCRRRECVRRSKRKQERINPTHEWTREHRRLNGRQKTKGGCDSSVATLRSGEKIYVIIFKSTNGKKKYSSKKCFK